MPFELDRTIITGVFEPPFTKIAGFSETQALHRIPIPQDLLALESATKSTQDDATMTRIDRDCMLESLDIESESEEEVVEQIDSDDDNAQIDSSHDRLAHPIHRIVMKDPSYNTFRAFLFYIASNRLSFAPLSSALPRGSASSPRPQSTSAPLPVSPKSMYRLAHKLEIPALRKLALVNFAAQLDRTNALGDYLDEVSLVHDEWRAVIYEVLVKSWTTIASSTEMIRLKEQRKRGELSAAKVGSLLEFLSIDAA